MPGSGKITTDFTVWCSKCEHWVQTSEHGNKSQFARFLKLRGWRFTRAWGWICPTHNYKYQKMLDKER